MYIFWLSPHKLFHLHYRSNVPALVLSLERMGTNSICDNVEKPLGRHTNIKY